MLEADLIATIEQRDALQHKETKMDKELIKLIEENGLTLHGDIEFFAHLVAERERKACVEMFDDEVCFYDYLEIAAKIRARGEQ